MPRRRLIAVLVTVACAMAPTAAAAQDGASAPVPDITQIPLLSPDYPGTPPDHGSSTPAASATAPSRAGPRAAASAGGLPDTGADARVLAAAGAALLLLGVGLRLRTADERF